MDLERGGADYEKQMLAGREGRSFLLIPLQLKPVDSHGCLLGWEQEGGGLHWEEEACGGGGGCLSASWRQTERREAQKHPHTADRDPIWDAQTQVGSLPTHEDALFPAFRWGSWGPLPCLGECDCV